MSKAAEQKPAYISRVHLKGYKSIRDLEIDFKAGLNIIVGPNGSGKTNFLEFLNHTFYNKSYTLLVGEPFYSNIDIVFNGGTQKNEKIATLKNKHGLPYLIVNDTINLNNKLLYESAYTLQPNGQIEYESINSNQPYLMLLPTLISFGNKLNEYLSNYLTLRYIKSEKDAEKFLFYSSKETDVVGKIVSRNDLLNFNVKKIQEKFTINLEIIGALKRFTLIKDLMVDTQKLNARLENDLLYVDNFELSFFVNNKWLNWKQLSDGTKRMFLIIVSTIGESGVLFLEEPELGIHPDQLHLLMDFLKEQSETKQIIITTHSPEVLNILDKNELDRIIVTRYDAEKGTQMHHLSDKQVRKGQMYMDKVGYLSNFWVHSNLEEYEAEEQTI